MSGVIKLSLREIEDLRCRLMVITTDQEINCAVCAGRSTWFCALDFAVCGNDYFAGYRQFADTGVEVHYFKCERCHFLFSPSFWSFTLSDYRRFVYNEDYVFADPPFKGERPRRDAVALQRILAKSDKSVRILDYGSGIGGLAHRMREQGFTNCDSFDPIYGVGLTPSGKFDFISCFEVIEHVKEQKGFAEMAKGLLKANGLLILSTQIQPVGLQAGTKPWWYIEPRNGHLSIHSKDSLNLLFRNEDLRVSEVCRDLFFVHADRNLPEPLLDHSFQREICADRNPLPPCQISL